MGKEGASAALMPLLSAAIARELQASIQYMLQHSIGATVDSPISAKGTVAQIKFIGSHSSMWLPGSTLKKVAITEMRHAEAIAERVVRLGGVPPTTADDVSLGTTAQEMLELDRELEQGAVDLYEQIIKVARAAEDTETAALFERILGDEKNHHRMFSNLLSRS